ncbi:MAG: RNA 2',3'-cyclic phosphodiesterase [Ignavibacteria bacterium]|nr:RNA 2',3'-cyclic phosphodiesterase [Ignavibacteria bacterium]
MKIRTFAALDPDESAIRGLAGFQNKLKHDLLRYGRDIRWEDPAKFHMTVFFVGEVENERSVRIQDNLMKAAADFSGKCLRFRAKSLTAFPNLRYPRVLVAEFEEETGGLAELAGNVFGAVSEFGLRQDKPFRPHITLARIRRDVKISLSEIDRSIPPVEFETRCLRYYKSTLQPGGSVYEVLAEFPFG